MSLWERIHRDPRYQEGKRRIQARYDLPLDFDIRLEPGKWREWMGTAEQSTGEQAERGLAFLRDVDALFRKFQVPEAWQEDFIADIAGRSYEEIHSKTEINSPFPITEIPEKVDDDPGIIPRDLTEIEKRDNAGIHSEEPEAATRWIKGLWETIRKWMRRT